jgi:hypothetical protein
MIPEGKKRLAVTLDEGIYDKVALYAKSLGVTKSQLVSVWVGQQILVLDKSMGIIDKYGATLIEKEKKK